MLGRSLLLACCVLPVAPAAQAQIYAGRSDEGVVTLSNFPSAAASDVVVSAPPAPAVLAQAAVPEPAVAAAPAAAKGADRFAPLISQAARDADLPARLLHAVIATESGFDARAVSRKGALGLMQLMPQTAQRFGAGDPFDPAQNVAAGAAYLKSLLGRFNNDLELALAAYNAGEGAVIKAGYRIPPYAETQAYVPRVLAHLRRAAALY